MRLAILILLLSAGLVRAQSVPRSKTVYFAQARVIAASTTSVPIEMDGGLVRAACQLQTANSAGSSPTLNVYLQHSIDGGVTWDDFVSFTQATTSTAKDITTWSETLAAGTNHAPADGTMTAGTERQEPIGEQVRAKFTLGGTSSPSYTVTLACHFQANF